MEEAVALFKEADEWVYSSDALHDYSRPDSDLYPYLVSTVVPYMKDGEWVYPGDDEPEDEVSPVRTVGDIVVLMNIVNDWGLPIPDDVLAKIVQAWHGYDDKTPLRPPYADRAARDKDMTPDEYMMYTMSKYYIPTFMHPETNKNNSYEASLVPLFGMPSDTLIKDRWKEYADGLNRGLILQWGTGGPTTPINMIVARTRFEFLDTLYGGPWNSDDRHLLIEDSMMDTIRDSVHRVYPNVTSLAPYLKVAIGAAGHRPNPDTTNIPLKIAIIIYIIYDALGASDALLGPMIEIIDNLSDGGEHMSAFNTMMDREV